MAKLKAYYSESLVDIVESLLSLEDIDVIEKKL